MTGYIPQETVERIKADTDIVDLISEYVNLKKAGKDFLGLCPFHREKTPSFTVVPNKGFFYCFGCGASGNAVNFIMRHENLEYAEALRFLARRAGIVIPEKRWSDRQSYAGRLHQAVEFAEAFFRKALHNSPAVGYLKSRGVGDEIRDELGLGYAPDGWDNLLSAALREKFPPELFFEAGLLVKKEGRPGEYYDKFRNRLMFPIRNLSGRVIGFGGRVLSDSESPKYLNSPETAIYHKGSVLYGLNHTKNQIREAGEAVILEGYFDFATTYQAGLKNVVAVSGTGFTPNQANLLARFCQKVILLYDGDSAGMKATLRAVETLYNAGLEPYIVRLPDGADPDGFIRKNGIGALKNLLDEAPGYIDFVKQSLPDEFTKMPISKQEKIIGSLAENARRIDDPLKHDLFVRKVIETFDLPASAAIRFARQPEAPQAMENRQELTGRAKFESLYLGFLLNHPGFLPESLRLIRSEQFSDDANRTIYDKLKDENHNDFSIGDFLEKIPEGEARRRLTEIIIRDSAGAPPDTLFEEFVRKFRHFQKQDRLIALRAEILQAEKEGQNQRLEQLTRAYRDIQNAAKGKAN